MQKHPLEALAFGMYSLTDAIYQYCTAFFLIVLARIIRAMLGKVQRGVLAVIHTDQQHIPIKLVELA